MASEKKVPRRIFVLKKENVAAQQRKLREDELHNLFRAC